MTADTGNSVRVEQYPPNSLISRILFSTPEMRPLDLNIFLQC